MLKLLRGRVASEAGFTLMELLVVVIIVGILAAVGVPLYLGYVRDSRLAEAKALAGSVLTAAQACAQQNTPNEAANCTRTQLAAKDIRKAQKALGHRSIEVTARHYVLDELEIGLTDELY